MKTELQTGTSTYQEEKKEKWTHSPKLQNKRLPYFAFTITFQKPPTVRLKYNFK